MKTVFTDGFTEGSWAGGGGVNHELLDTAQLATFRVKCIDPAEGYGFDYGDMIVTAMSESLEEGIAQMSTKTDSYVAFSTGAMPVGIMIRGFVARMPTQDGRLDFLFLYNDIIRGTKMEFYAFDMEVLLKGRAMFSFSLQSIVVSETITYENLTEITLTGVGYNYQPVALVLE